MRGAIGQYLYTTTVFPFNGCYASLPSLFNSTALANINLQHNVMTTTNTGSNIQWKLLANTWMSPNTQLGQLQYPEIWLDQTTCCTATSCTRTTAQRQATFNFQCHFPNADYRAGYIAFYLEVSINHMLFVAVICHTCTCTCT